MNILRGIALALIVAGLISFGNIVWVHTGQSYIASVEQAQLVEEFKQSAVASARIDNAVDIDYDVEAGDTIGIIEIPKLNIEAPIIEGTGTEELKKGVGHYPNINAYAGHRTTYGQPFHDLDKLAAGDEIIINNKTYTMSNARIVSPEETEVLNEADLVLTTCHPKYSNEQRLVIFASEK